MALQKSHRNTVAPDNLYFAFCAVFIYVAFFGLYLDPYNALFATSIVLAIAEVVVQTLAIQEMSFTASCLRFTISMIPVITLHTVCCDMLNFDSILIN